MYYIGRAVLAQVCPRLVLPESVKESLCLNTSGLSPSRPLEGALLRYPASER